MGVGKAVKSPDQEVRLFSCSYSWRIHIGERAVVKSCQLSGECAREKSFDVIWCCLPSLSGFNIELFACMLLKLRRLDQGASWLSSAWQVQASGQLSSTMDSQRCVDIRVSNSVVLLPANQFPDTPSNQLTLNASILCVCLQGKFFIVAILTVWFFCI